MLAEDNSRLAWAAVMAPCCHERSSWTLAASTVLCLSTFGAVPGGPSAVEVLEQWHAPYMPLSTIQLGAGAQGLWLGSTYP